MTARSSGWLVASLFCCCEGKMVDVLPSLGACGCLGSGNGGSVKWGACWVEGLCEHGPCGGTDCKHNQSSKVHGRYNCVDALRSAGFGKLGVCCCRSACEHGAWGLPAELLARPVMPRPRQRHGCYRAAAPPSRGPLPHPFPPFSTLFHRVHSSLFSFIDCGGMQALFRMLEAFGAQPPEGMEAGRELLKAKMSARTSDYRCVWLRVVQQSVFAAQLSRHR